MRRTLLNPKIDFVFKKIFGSEEHPEILISFLNAVLKPKNNITDVEIKNTDIDKSYIEDKFSRLDVKAVTSKNEIINIEIQLKNEYNMIKRSLYYWSKMYEEQLNEGDDYSKLERTICINILNFKYLDNNRIHNGYRLKEIETNEELTDLGVYLYTTEVNSVNNYWFDIDGDILDSNYTASTTSANKHNVASIVWGGKYDYSAWWTAGSARARSCRRADRPRPRPWGRGHRQRGREFPP